MARIRSQVDRIHSFATEPTSADRVPLRFGIRSGQVYVANTGHFYLALIVSVCHNIHYAKCNCRGDIGMSGSG